MRRFHVIAGLPRAGSTLLCQILNSNPKFSVTPTSGVLGMLKTMRSNFSQNPSFRAQNRLEIYENFRMGLRGFLEGYFYDSEVVFDKNRAWTSNMSLLDTILQNNETKIIWLYRDPVEIISSIEAHYQKTLLLENMDEGGAPGAFMTLERRISTYVNPDGLMGFPIESLKDALEMGFGSRIMFIKYFELTNFPEEVLKAIHNFLGEEYYEYDFKNIKQSTWEFDGIYNYKFPHVIKEGEIKYKKADITLDPKYVQAINETYLALNKLIFELDPNLLLKTPNNLIPNNSQDIIETPEYIENEKEGLFDKILKREEDF